MIGNKQAKSIGKTVISAAIAVCFCLLCGCSGCGPNYNEIASVKSEVEYGYIAVGDECLVNNGKICDYEKVAKAEVLKENRTGNKSEVYRARIVGDFVYYLYCYRETGDGDDAVYDIALMKTNIFSGETEIAYNFKDAVKPYKKGYPSGGVSELYLYYKLDDNRLLFVYNGTCSVYDIGSGEIAQSLALFEPKEFVEYDSWNAPFRVNNLPDFHLARDNDFFYYVYDDGCFIEHKFENVFRRRLVNRKGDYVYLYDWDGYKASNEIYLDLKTNKEAENSDEVKSLFEEKENGGETEELKFEKDGNEYVVKPQQDGKSYTVEGDDYSATADTEKLYKNNSFKRLNEIYDPKYASYEIKPFVKEDRLFFEVAAYDNWTHGVASPLYIFKYDLFFKEFKYVGFMKKIKELLGFYII